MDARKTILIVDDEEDLTWGISRNLSNSNYGLCVDCANDGDAALELIEGRRYDLVISDYRMPGRNGLQLMLDVRQRHPDTKIILMTAFGSNQVLRKAEERGSFFYIEKPFEMGYLKQLVFEALDLGDCGFEGVVGQVGIRQLIELSCARKKNASLLISGTQETGAIYFKDGEVVHAECGALQGESAFFSMLNWRQGTFSISNGMQVRQRTISRDWKSLIHQQI